MQWLAKVSVERPVFATVLVLMICVLGATGYAKLGVDRFPDVDIPTVAVTTAMPGASPEEVESELTDRIEEAVNTVAGISELRSVSGEGLSRVWVGFEVGQDVDEAATEIRDRVQRVLGKLPEAAEMPEVAKLDPAASPIVYLAIKGGPDLRATSEVADKLVRRRLEAVDGVGQVSLIGDQKRALRVHLDPLRLAAFNMTVSEVERAIRSQNLTVPGGRLEAGPAQLSLRVRGRVGSPEELAQLVVRDDPSLSVRLRDVGRIEDGVAEPASVARADGKPVVVLSIRKRSGANTVRTVDAVNERLAELKADLPRGYHLEVSRDESQVIRTSVGAVRDHLFEGSLFAAAIVLLFLGNLRSTLIAALAIPISLIGTFALMWWKGFTLNVITLLALALAIGIVIDDAIVVLENIARFVDEKSMHPRKAAIAATREIGLAVLATTLSLIAVFLPVSFMSGIVGRFLESFGLSMAFAIAVSLLVSFTLTPMLSARWLKPHTGTRREKSLLERAVDRFYLPIERGYGWALRWAMAHRSYIVLACLASLAAVVPLFAAVDKGFLPKNDEAHFEVRVRAPEGTSLSATVLHTERIARMLEQEAWVSSTLVFAGHEGGLQNVGQVYVRMTHPKARSLTQDEAMSQARALLARAPKSLEIKVSEVPVFQGGATMAKVMYDLTGPDLVGLAGLNEQILARMRKVSGAVDVSSNLVTGKPEVVALIDRERAAALGVRAADVAGALRTLVGGSEVSSYEEAGERYDVLLRAEAGFRADPAGLMLLSVPSTRLGSVRLSELVRLEQRSGPAEINRLGRRRLVTFMANVAPGASEGAVSDEVRRAIESVQLPAGYSVLAAGNSKEMARASQAFMLAFALSFVFMYLVLAAQFESFVHPITILISLPLTLPFALLSLLLLGQQLDIFSTLGLLVLFGVVKKNAILQIDQTNQLRERGMDRLPAILEANRERLRPILMTSLAFVAGMVPLSLSSGIGAGFNQATSGVIVGGQMLSLLLTLLATPVIYSLFDDCGAWLERRFSPVATPGARRSVLPADPR